MNKRLIDDLEMDLYWYGIFIIEETKRGLDAKERGDDSIVASVIENLAILHVERAHSQLSLEQLQPRCQQSNCNGLAEHSSEYGNICNACYGDLWQEEYID